jgi:hypothetical protein
MATQQIPIRRGGQDYILFIGIDDNGESVLYVDQSKVDETTGQPVRFYPDKLTINFSKGEGKGGVAFIYTEWERGLIGASGNPIPGTGQPKSMITNKQDETNFIAAFGMPILMSMDNGFIRAILGFNDLPPFNPQTGAVIEYTAEQEDAEPTNNYHPLPDSIEQDGTATHIINPQ